MNKPTILMLSVIILAVAVLVVAGQQGLEAELAQLEGGVDDKILEVKNG